MHNLASVDVAYETENQPLSKTTSQFHIIKPTSGKYLQEGKSPTGKADVEIYFINGRVKRIGFV